MTGTTLQAKTPLKRTPFKKKSHMVSRRSKATDIPVKVKKIVNERDEYCVFCGLCGGLPNCHVISRAKGGLGIPENIVKAHIECHNKYDNGCTREEHEAMYDKAVAYLKTHYSKWRAEDCVYHKWP